VTDADARKAYLSKIDALETEARDATADAETPYARGEKLLRFLHAGPMARGYSLHQSSLAVLLDTGKFNCVSSAVLYNVLARRLGLDVRAIEIPGHVFSILYDGDRAADVETTTREGFNPARTLREKLAAEGGTAYIPEKHKKLRREVGDWGLVALLYYNRGVERSLARQFPEAVRADFCSLCLDSDNPHTGRNAQVDLNNWVAELAQAGKYSQAVEVTVVWANLGPKEGNPSRLLGFLVQEWARGAHAEKGPEEAAAVLEAALVRFPGNKDVKSAVANHVHLVTQQQLKERRYEEALATAARYGVLMKDKEEPRKAAARVYDAWASDLAKRKEWQQAVEVYARGLKAQPGNKQLENNLVATVDQWAAPSVKAKDWATAVKVYEKGLEVLPGHKHLTARLQFCQKQLNG
jgi:tetratricopeptide (TPR) repeat protein